MAVVAGGAAADPASLGVAWMLAAATSMGELKDKYEEVVQQELEYLLNAVPKTMEGAMSMRPASEAPQLWCAFCLWSLGRWREG
jgi:hypothetical protein